MVAELLANGSYLIDLALLMLIIFSLLIGILMQRKTRQKIGDMEKDIVKYQGDVFEDLNNKYVSLKEAFSEKTNNLIAKLNAILKGNKAVMSEIDNKTMPLKISLDDAMEKVKATKDTLRKTILENEKELKKMRKEIDDFSKEIQKMKDDIRERAIDLEL
jgi:predicted  nucleic acid-binding Zn-ribbon protein